MSDGIKPLTDSDLKIPDVDKKGPDLRAACELAEKIIAGEITEVTLAQLHSLSEELLGVVSGAECEGIL